MVAYFSDTGALPINTRWQGPGLYILTSWQNTTPPSFEWMPAACMLGVEPDREENNDFTVSPFHIGRMVRVNNSATRTVTIPEGIVTATFPLARIWIMRQGSGRVFFQETTGTPTPVWKTTTGLGVLKEIPRQYQIVELWLLWNPDLNSSAGGTEIYATHDIMPDGEFQHATRYHWTTATVGTPPVASTAQSPFVVGNTHAGKIVRVTNASPSFLAFNGGTVPGGLEGCWFKVMKAGTGDVTIQAGSGMTARFPGGSTYTITQQRKIVTVHLTGTVGNETNSVYIEE